LAINSLVSVTSKSCDSRNSRESNSSSMVVMPIRRWVWWFFSDLRFTCLANPVPGSRDVIDARNRLVTAIADVRASVRARMPLPQGSTGPHSLDFRHRGIPPHS
jgi:hypothetical protein